MKTYISLFSSAGIGCYGFKMEGFECIATNEIIERRLGIQNPIINVNIPRATSVVILPRKKQRNSCTMKSTFGKRGKKSRKLML